MRLFFADISSSRNIVHCWFIDLKHWPQLYIYRRSRHPTLRHPACYWLALPSFPKQTCCTRLRIVRCSRSREHALLLFHISQNLEHFLHIIRFEHLRLGMIIILIPLPVVKRIGQNRMHLATQILSPAKHVLFRHIYNVKVLNGA